MKLSYYINFILSLEGSPVLKDTQVADIDGFDDAVLMIDDIQDQSKIRDEKSCYYIVHGIEEAKRKAKELQKRAFKALNDICDSRKLSLISKLKARFLLYKFYRAIERGQKIDLYLEHTPKTNSSLISKYDEMVRLFTGGHIKYGFLLGCLFSGKKLSYRNNIASIGEKIGIIRQIVDDIKDYEEKHHEPLGDLVNHKKRIPELFFLLSSSDEKKKQLQALLVNSIENFLDIKSLIFNEKVQFSIQEKILKLKNEINVEIMRMPLLYQTALLGLLEKTSSAAERNFTSLETHGFPTL